MKFIKFPNGKVWRVQADGTVAGTLAVPGLSELSDTESWFEGVAIAATGASCCTTGAFVREFCCHARGGNLVSFSAKAVLPKTEAEFKAAGFSVIASNSAELAEALRVQYGLLDLEVSHAMMNLETEVDLEAESCLEVLGSFRQIWSPAHPADCDYVRIVVDGFEIAYWTADEWQEDPACVMGAILGAANGS